MKLKSDYKLRVIPCDTRPGPLRLSVGDVIRCERFSRGIRFSRQKEIMVGWRDDYYPEYHARTGNGKLMNDETRAKSPFLVVLIEFDENGPNDVISDWRLSIIVKCLRLTEDYELMKGAEFVTFSKREPMSVAQPPDNEIELIGYASLPIGLQPE